MPNTISATFHVSVIDASTPRLLCFARRENMSPVLRKRDVTTNLLRGLLLVGLFCLSRQEKGKTYLISHIPCVFIRTRLGAIYIGIIFETPIVVPEFELV